MRKKSPASVQKWVDSIQLPSHAGPSSSGNIAHDDVEETDDENEEERVVLEDVTNADVNVLTPDESNAILDNFIEEQQQQQPQPSPITFKKFLAKNPILEKFSRSTSHLESDCEMSEPNKGEDNNSKKSSTFASISKSKINEFYDKLSINKAKYNLIKSKKLDIKSMINLAKDRMDETQPESASETKQSEENEPVIEIAISDDDRLELNTSDIYEFSFDESFPKDNEEEEERHEDSDDDEKENIEIPQFYDSYLNPKKTYRMGDIGRSSSENPSANKRYNLLEIGRSFSEMDDDSFVINEGNNSCPNPSSLNTSSSINNSINNILTRSVPVSPIPRTSSKLSIQQDHSMSESPRRRNTLLKESSIQSDSSRCSSVESLLNARKPDPERILINLGFGPAHTTDVLSKIPKRFLKPSQVRGVDTEAFLRQQQLSMHIHENSVLGYRGLVGNPHIPPSMIVAKIMERFQVNEKNRLVVNCVTQNDSRPSTGPPSPIPTRQPTESRT